MKITFLSVLSSYLVLGALAISAGAQPPKGKLPKLTPPPAPPKGTKIFRDLAYVPNGGAKRTLDLYLPPSSDAKKLSGVIVYIHGGAFMFGDNKSGFLPTRVLKNGYALAAINYRLSGDARFPAQIEDCKAAVRFLRAHAAQYHLDPTRFVSWGESAGGGLAALVGTSGQTKTFDVGANLKYSSAVQGVVDLYGPTDFLQMDAHRVPGGDLHDLADSPESRLIGGAIQQNKAKVKRENPITYVSRRTPPFFIAHGTQDSVVPYHQSQLLVAALRKAGVKFTLLPVSGAGHGFKDATPAQLRQIDEKTDAFLKNLFAARK